MINAAGSPSRLGGTVLELEVRAAMDAASQHFVPIAEMQETASQVIAEATGAEAGCVASGAAACLFLASAACVAGPDRAAIDRLPDTTGLRDEIAVHRAHRNPFDHAIRATGATFVEFGYLGISSGVGAHRWQLEAALSARTAAVFYVAGRAGQVLPLPTVVEIAHARDIPVIVDAAGALPPATNLRRFIDEGADLVAFSGGKDLGGPAASGFLAGRRELIAAAALQQQDMHVHPSLWSAPVTGAGDEEPPHQGMARAMKVGREELAGLIVAIQAYLERDHQAAVERWLETCEAISTGLRDRRIVQTTLVGPPETDLPRVVLTFPTASIAADVAGELQRGRPRVFLAALQIDQAELLAFPNNVRSEDVPALVRRLDEALAAVEGGRPGRRRAGPR